MVKMLKSVDVFHKGIYRKKANSFSKKTGAPKATRKSKDEKSLKILDFSA